MKSIQGKCAVNLCSRVKIYGDLCKLHSEEHKKHMGEINNINCTHACHMFCGGSYPKWQWWICDECKELKCSFQKR